MPVEFKDYYATLGVARDASEDAINDDLICIHLGFLRLGGD